MPQAAKVEVELEVGLGVQACLEHRSGGDALYDLASKAFNKQSKLLSNQKLKS